MRCGSEWAGRPVPQRQFSIASRSSQRKKGGNDGQAGYDAGKQVRVARSTPWSTAKVADAGRCPLRRDPGLRRGRLSHSGADSHRPDNAPIPAVRGTEIERQGSLRVFGRLPDTGVSKRMEAGVRKPLTVAEQQRVEIEPQSAPVRFTRWVPHSHLIDPPQDAEFLPLTAARALKFGATSGE